jgi:C4-dicarboxylate-specific signal transduction histidine kinase
MTSPINNIPVLIVDDRQENLSSLEALLNDMPIDLVQAQSGNEALRHALYTDFALVLLDVQMPEMDGFETAELMRKIPKTREVPVIFITAGMKDQYHLFKGYEAGAVDYLMKPINPIILRSKVRVFCDLYQHRRELERVQATLEVQNEELLGNQAELEAQNERLLKAHHELQEETAEKLLAVEGSRKSELLMIQQSRMAAMGEMLNNIAHQWRQPMNVLGLKVQEIGLSYELGTFNQQLLDSNIAKVMEILEHMSQTIADFQGFSAPDKEKSVFRVNPVVAKMVSLVRGNFLELGITVELDNSGEPQINGYPNEYGQVLLNLLANAKDALREKGTSGALITVRTWTDDGRAVLTITDNAGGIEENILVKIFDPYFTTKESAKGTGIGLFMSKTIIEKNMGGRLTVRNVVGGAEFSIEV